MFNSLTIVNWGNPSEFLFFQVPAMILSAYITWRLAQIYARSSYEQIQQIINISYKKKYFQALKFGFKTLFFIAALFLCCASFLGVTSGLFGLNIFENFIAWNFGALAIIPVVFYTELSQKQPKNI